MLCIVSPEDMQACICTPTNPIKPPASFPHPPKQHSKRARLRLIKQAFHITTMMQTLSHHGKAGTRSRRTSTSVQGNGSSSSSSSSSSSVLLFAVGACGGGGIVVVEVEAMIFFFLGWRCGDSRTKEKETVVLPGF